MRFNTKPAPKIQAARAATPRLIARRQGYDGPEEVEVAEPEVTLVRGVYQAVNDDDLEAFLAVMHPEVELATSGVYPDFRPTYVGREGALEYWRAARGVWEAFAIDISRCERVGEHVLAEIHQRVLGRDEIAVEHRWAHLFSVEDGLVRRVRAYLSWEEALANCGFERGEG